MQFKKNKETTPAEKEKEVFRFRWRTMAVAMAVIFLGFGAAWISLFNWQVIHGEEMQTAALDQSLRSVTLSAKRGTIYDATGTKVLAKSAQVWSVVLESHFIMDDENLRQKISQKLSEVLEMDQQEIYEKTGEDSYYYVLKRQVETDKKEEIKKFLDDEGITKGVMLLEDYKRYYPYGTTASSVLGFTGTDGDGLAGLEYQYNSELQGTAGRKIISKTALEQDTPFEAEQLIEPQDGNNLVLTLDETVQSVMEKHLEQGIEQYQVKNGAVAILMNVKTGGIVGMAVKGDYDPNDPFTVYDQETVAEIEALPEDEQDQAYSDALNKQWRNKAVSDTYYPGSVYKMCVAAMGLEEGVIDEDDTFTCTGNMPVQGVDGGIYCWEHSGHGVETLHDGLCNSCNPFFIHIGELLGAETFAKYREAFGITSPTGIDLPGESWSLYYDVEDLHPAELATESFGQNFSITPIQMITASAVIANGGYLVTPHIVDRIVDAEGNIIKTADTGYRRQVISQETAETITSYLLDNATFGTANGGYVMGYRVCGKTGTSEKVAEYNANTDPDKKMQYIASYCGFAPAEDPQYALLVFFDEPQGDLNGGNAVAGPIFASIMEEVLPYLGVEAQYTEEEYDTLGSTAPALTTKTLGEAIALLEEEGIQYSVVGDSEDMDQTITDQVPQVGEAIPKDGKVVLYTQGYSESDIYVEVPDFTGTYLYDAYYMAANSGLQINATGAGVNTGSAGMQSVEPGTKVKLGTVITVTFVDNTNTETYVSLG